VVPQHFKQFANHWRVFSALGRYTYVFDTANLPSMATAWAGSHTKHLAHPSLIADAELIVSTLPLHHLHSIEREHELETARGAWSSLGHHLLLLEAMGL